MRIISKNVTHTSPNKPTPETHCPRPGRRTRYILSPRIIRNTQGRESRTPEYFDSQWKMKSPPTRGYCHTFSSSLRISPQAYKTTSCRGSDCSHEYHDLRVIFPLLNGTIFAFFSSFFYEFSHTPDISLRIYSLTDRSVLFLSEGWRHNTAPDSTSISPGR